MLSHEQPLNKDMEVIVVTFCLSSVCVWEGRESVGRGGGGKQGLSKEQSTE